MVRKNVKKEGVPKLKNEVTDTFNAACASTSIRSIVVFASWSNSVYARGWTDGGKPMWFRIAVQYETT
jgi:hypothetical protein